MISDDVIERVLAGLADIKAQPAIERRVLQAIEHRARERKMAGSPWFIFRPWVVASGVILFTIAGSITVRKRHEARHEQAVLKPHTSLMPVPATEIAAAQPNLRPQKTSLPASSRDASISRPQPVSDEEALAIEEMNAPSRPAPPLPLTRQEKLLAEAAHPDSAIELSSLRPEIRAQQMELSKAEFHAFFDPRPTKDNE